jgi:hypothetical protein
MDVLIQVGRIDPGWTDWARPLARICLPGLSTVPPSAWSLLIVAEAWCAKSLRALAMPV